MLKIYNTLTRRKEEFKPLKDKKINIFVCGTTSYDYSHIGHAKTYIQFDIIVRYLRFKKYKVFYLQNITDVDDKIIEKAKEEKTSWKEISRKFEKSHLEDMKSLGVKSVNKYARATDHIKEIVKQIKILIDKGYAYKIDDGYYFDLKKFKDYGKLSRRTDLKEEDSVSRIDESIGKRNKGDFCLWKFSNEQPNWKTELKILGRPGWHIEDTAITEKYFGQQYDMHGGAIDLIFPHHEAEIAQMESISGKKPFVRYWMHTGFLNVNGKKMSKSLGNFITIKEFAKKYDVNVIRFLFALSHYRSNIDFSYGLMENAKNSLERLQDFFEKVKKGKDNEKSIVLVNKYKKNFIDAMDNDFDSPKAFAILFEFVREINKVGGGKKVYRFMLDVNEIFGILKLKKEILTNEIKRLIQEREKARKEKDWKKADEIRETLRKKGITLEDTEKGVVWKRL